MFPSSVLVEIAVSFLNLSHELLFFALKDEDIGISQFVIESVGKAISADEVIFLFREERRRVLFGIHFHNFLTKKCNVNFVGCKWSLRIVSRFVDFGNGKCRIVCTKLNSFGDYNCVCSFRVPVHSLINSSVNSLLQSSDIVRLSHS